MKKYISLLLTIILSIGLLSGCGSNAKQSNSNKKQVVKIGITGDDHKIWDKIKVNLSSQAIDLEIVSFADYVRPNLALSDGDIDLNAFQTYVYMNKFKKDHNLAITAIGETVFAPLAIYSKNLKSIKDLKSGAKIGIPNDATNESRGLILLQKAGLITLKAGSGTTPTLKDISKNPKNIKLVELVATQIPRSLQDVDAAIINSGVAIDAKLDPIKDSIFKESAYSSTSKPYVNVIVSREKDKNSAVYKKVVKAYQSAEIKQFIKTTYKGAQIPMF